MTTRAFLTIFSLVFFSLTGFTHEGHDHGAPKGIVAPKGGLIRALEQTIVEVVAKANTIKIYLYDRELKPLEVAPFTITAKAQKPRVKKKDDIILKPSGNYFEGTYDAGGIHRFTLLLSVKDPKEEHSDNLKYTIEPKK